MHSSATRPTPRKAVPHHVIVVAKRFILPVKKKIIFSFFFSFIQEFHLFEKRATASIRGKKLHTCNQQIALMPFHCRSLNYGHVKWIGSNCRLTNHEFYSYHSQQPTIIVSTSYSFCLLVQFILVELRPRLIHVRILLVRWNKK